jgi:hypothetical protein
VLFGVKKDYFSEINNKMVELSGGQDGFKILQVKFDAESQCPRHIFFKNHNVKAGCSKNRFFKTTVARYFSLFFYLNAVNLSAQLDFLNVVRYTLLS